LPKRHDLYLQGIALLAHVRAQFASVDIWVRLDPEQPRLGTAPIAIGRATYVFAFHACLGHVFKVGFAEVFARVTFVAPHVT
jgi:hypothetical protein